MRTARSRVVAAPRERLWDVVADPWHEPRWWPRVQRVEGVSRRGWTSVLISRRGATVRVDWVVEDARRPEWRRWAQELDGTAFERVFARNAVEAALERQADGGTRVTLTYDQQVRGLARLLPFIVRRPMRRQLDAALAGLAEAVEP
jgi:uncharacterized protein YndB with AHSA1/START domain